MPQRRSLLGGLAVALLALAACGGEVTPRSSGSPSGPAPISTGPVAVGPAAFAPPKIDAAVDPRRELAALETEDRERLRTQAGFAARVGAGWTALSGATGAALEAGLRSLAAEFAVEPPVATRDRRLASVAGPPPVDLRRANVSSAAAMAIVMAAITAGQALGSSGTREAASVSSQTTTDGDEGATMSVKMTGRVAGSGSRVTADFTFELSGQVVNRVTGATARLTGRAAAHVEVDGCPDANGSSKGKLVLTSGESVTGGPDGGSASWTRDLQGTFDISVDDSASISGLVLDATAQESVRSGTSGAPSGHELGGQAHWEYGSGQGFTGLTGREGTSRGSVTNEQNATAADLVRLFKSAAQSISAAAILLGIEAERFWRNGKCVEVLVDPQGGDVDPDSVTSITAKVRHKYENRELDKPVEATLVGVKAIDPAGEKQPAPATVKLTAGSKTGDVGEITFKTVSNRGIGEKTVRFTVRPGAWNVTSTGSTVETFGPVSNSLAVNITALKIVAGDGGKLTGTGKMQLSGQITSGPCSGILNQVVDFTITGTLAGSGPDQKLTITIYSPAPAGQTYTMTCPVGPPVQMGSEGHSDRYGETLGAFELPAAGGTVSVTRDKAIGGIMQVTASGTFVVTPVTP